MISRGTLPAKVVSGSQTKTNETLKSQVTEQSPTAADDSLQNKSFAGKEAVSATKPKSILKTSHTRHFERNDLSDSELSSSSQTVTNSTFVNVREFPLKKATNQEPSTKEASNRQKLRKRAEERRKKVIDADSSRGKANRPNRRKLKPKRRMKKGPSNHAGASLEKPTNVVKQADSLAHMPEELMDFCNRIGDRQIKHEEVDLDPDFIPDNDYVADVESLVSPPQAGPDLARSRQTHEVLINGMRYEFESYLGYSSVDDDLSSGASSDNVEPCDGEKLFYR